MSTTTKSLTGVNDRIYQKVNAPGKLVKKQKVSFPMSDGYDLTDEVTISYYGCNVAIYCYATVLENEERTVLELESKCCSLEEAEQLFKNKVKELSSND